MKQLHNYLTSSVAVAEEKKSSLGSFNQFNSLTINRLLNTVPSNTRNKLIYWRTENAPCFCKISLTSFLLSSPLTAYCNQSICWGDGQCRRSGSVHCDSSTSGSPFWVLPLSLLGPSLLWPQPYSVPASPSFFFSSHLSLLLLWCCFFFLLFASSLYLPPFLGYFSTEVPHTCWWACFPACWVHQLWSWLEHTSSCTGNQQPHAHRSSQQIQLFLNHKVCNNVRF